MGIVELVLLSAGLAMDAFSVAVCKGLSMKKFRLADAFIIALFFGSFQAAMPLIGYLLGSRFADNISAYSHWAAFLILGFIGGKMLYESLHDSEGSGEKGECRLKFGELFVLSVATSIDALAVGIVFAASDTELLSAVTLIGVITFVLSFAGAAMGSRFGGRYEKKAEIAGGAILILIGLKLFIGGIL